MTARRKRKYLGAAKDDSGLNVVEQAWVDGLPYENTTTNRNLQFRMDCGNIADINPYYEQWPYATLWSDHAAAKLDDWIQSKPFTRPPLWWKVEAPELVEVVNDSGDRKFPSIFTDWYSKLNIDDETRYQHDLKYIESQKDYLTRLDFFTDFERAIV